MAIQAWSEEEFDPELHLQYKSPTQRYTFESLGITKWSTATDVAATSPFSFLSRAGVEAYRRALAAQGVLDNCAHSPYKNTLVLRNVAAHSKFIKDLWTHPKTLKIIEEVAKVPLVPYYQYEIGQTNAQVKGSTVGEMVKELASKPSMVTRELTAEEKVFDPLKGNSIIPWHYDSYPYVLVVTLSNTTGGRGGETYLKLGDGTPLKVEGSTVGHAILLQGGEVQHLAARAVGVDERITTITSMRAMVPSLYDNSYLANVRPVSKLPVIYREWIDVRLEKMKEEISNLQLSLSKLPRDAPWDISTVHKFADVQMAYLKRTTDQLVDYQLHEKVIRDFGQDAYYAVAECWTQIAAHPEFQQRLNATKEGNFRPGSHLWVDLYASRTAIANGQALRGQLGDIRWDKKRQFTMGDELLRQGLREEFFQWLRSTSLHEISPYPLRE